MCKNISELLFEQYLADHGYNDWEYEPSVPGKAKKPDYLVRWNGAPYLFEVKERSMPDDWELNTWPRHCDPSAGIRQEIQEARQKFREFKEFPCSLVLYNNADPETWLRPMHVFSAMLGRLTLTMPFDGTRACTERAGAVFDKGGTMVRDKTGDYQNTTISAVIVLEKIRPIPTAAGGQSMPPNQILRVVVDENPGAKFPFPRELFAGRHDERWAYLEEPVANEHGMTQAAVGIDGCEVADPHVSIFDGVSDEDEYI